MNPLINLPKERIAKLCRENNIRRLAVFGSALRDDFSPASDIDLLVEFQPGTRVGLGFFRIERQLADLLGRNVDLNTPGFLSRHFRDRVAREAEILYDDA